jgi:hypothetical protein
VPNQGFERAPFTALRVVTAITDGLAPIPAGVSGPADANAVSALGVVEQPPRLAANAARPRSNMRDLFGTKIEWDGSAIESYGPQCC